MAKKKLIDEIKVKPARFYRVPNDVIRDRRFRDEERLEILDAWQSQAALEPQDENTTLLMQLVQDARKELERRIAP